MVVDTAHSLFVDNSLCQSAVLYTIAHAYNSSKNGRRAAVGFQDSFDFLRIARLRFMIVPNR